MEKKKELADCGICGNNKGNQCMSQDGYYIYREAIMDELVPCNDWTESQDSFAYKLETRQLLKKTSR